MGKNTVIKYVMGFESWEGEYTAVQLINNNGLTRVLTGCFVYINGATWQPSPDGRAALPRRMLSTGTSSFLAAGVPSAPCQMQGTCP